MNHYETESKKHSENETRLDTYYKGFWVSGVTIWHDAGSLQSHVNDLFVAEDVRRQGHGRQMMEHIVAEFPTRQLSLMVYPDNTGAILLYEQIGFVSVGPLDEMGLQLMTREGTEMAAQKVYKKTFEAYEFIKDLELPIMGGLSETSPLLFMAVPREMSEPLLELGERLNKEITAFEKEEGDITITSRAPRLILTEALNDETSETQACFQLEIEVSFTHEDDNV